MRRQVRDLLRDGVLAPLLTLAGGFVVARVASVAFDLVAFGLTLPAALVLFVGLGGIRGDGPVEDGEVGLSAWWAALDDPEAWPAFFAGTRRALVYATGLFVLAWVAVAVAPRLP
jgi:hypothetical protein